MIFQLLREVATAPKSTSDSMSNPTIIALDPHCKKLTNQLFIFLKRSYKAVPIVAGNPRILDPQLFESSLKLFDRR